MSLLAKAYQIAMHIGVQVLARVGWVLATLMVWLIRVYQFLGRPVCVAVFGGWAACRFHPSCSEYTVLALRIYGPIKGASLAARRLLRCHPFSPGGFDPVPGIGDCAGAHKTQQD